MRQRQERMLLMKLTNSNDKKARENLPKRLIKPDGLLTQSSEEVMQT